MMHLFINGLGASAGGGLTYLKNVLPHLSKAGVRTTVATTQNFQALSNSIEHVEYIQVPGTGSAARRFWLEQRDLPRLIHDCKADVLLSAGNFALRRSPVPQILLSRNSLYTCPEFFGDLLARGEYRMWIENRLKSFVARRSVTWADCTVAPSAAFAQELERWSGKPVLSVHHGFDNEFFNADQQCIPEDIRQKLDCPPGTMRVLLVSHYNYYRNFETVFRAIAQFREQFAAPQIRLFLTCQLQKMKTPGGYNPGSASRLIDELGIREHVIELGAIPYEQLHHIYRACDIFVTAAYTETFAHPLVEAMSCGLPIIASALPVHYEICGDAALYFPPFSPADLASQLARTAATEQVQQSLSAEGRERAQAFSWQAHVKWLLALAEELLGAGKIRGTAAQSASAA